MFTRPNDDSENKINYVCINCGNDVDELYKKYSSSVLKISNCNKCNKVADKYIEFETLIIVIDLILLSRPAYRHILYNTECKNIWKLAIILILLESYCLYTDTFDHFTSIKYKSRINDPQLSEKGFYVSTLHIVISNVLLFIFIRLLTIPYTSIVNADQPPKHKRSISIDLVRGIILASVGKFFFLPIMIWKDNSTQTGIGIHLGLVIAYFVLSLIHAHSVVANCSRVRSTFIIILAFISETYILSEMSYYLKLFIL